MPQGDYCNKIVRPGALGWVDDSTQVGWDSANQKAVQDKGKKKKEYERVKADKKYQYTLAAIRPRRKGWENASPWCGPE